MGSAQYDTHSVMSPCAMVVHHSHMYLAPCLHACMNVSTATT